MTPKALEMARSGNGPKWYLMTTPYEAKWRHLFSPNLRYSTVSGPDFYRILRCFGHLRGMIVTR